MDNMRWITRNIQFPKSVRAQRADHNTSLFVLSCLGTQSTYIGSTGVLLEWPCNYSFTELTRIIRHRE
jgi:hypothetical protein